VENPVTLERYIPAQIRLINSRDPRPLESRIMARKRKRVPERRKFSRKTADEIVEIRTPRHEEWEKVPLSDLGRGGMGFFSDIQLDLGDPIQMRVRFSPGRGSKGSEVVSGKVAWIRPHAFFHAGIVFASLDPERHRRLLEMTRPGHSGAQPQKTDRLIWKGWIRNLLERGTLQRRDLLELTTRKGNK